MNINFWQIVLNRYFYLNNKNLNIPYSPDRKYKKEWKGWPDFLGYKK